MRSERVYCNVSFRNHAGFKALYDTGANVSLLSPRAFEHARDAQCVIKRLQTSLSLSNVSGKSMHIDGIFLIRTRIEGRTVDAVWIVTPDLRSNALIGMNIIRKNKLSLDGESQRVVWPAENKKPDLRAHGVSLVVRSETSIDPSRTRLVPCKLVDAAGEPIKGSFDFIADVAGICFGLQSDDDGRVNFPVPNPMCCDMILSRGTSLGSAQGRSQYTFIDKKKLAVVSAARSVAIGRKCSQSRPPRPIDAEEMKTALGRDLSLASRKKLVDLLQKYEKCVSRNKHDIGFSDLVSHNIKLTTDQPIYTQQFRLPWDHLKVLKECVREWMKSGIVEDCNSKSNSPLFCVPKPLGRGLRPVQDFRLVNSMSHQDRYSLRSVEECVEHIGRSGAKIFTAIDLRSSFHQQNLEEASRDVTAFTLPGETQKRWVGTPMGLRGASASFTRLMECVMSGLDFVIIYIDDILIFSKSESDHMNHVEEVLRRLTKHNLKLNLGKTQFARQELQYLGLTLTSEGCLPGLEKTAAIREAKPPTNLKQVKSFCGLTNHFRAHIQNFARLAAPLFELTKSASTWKSGPIPPDALAAFEALKLKITSAPILAYPNPTGKYHLFTDGALGDKKNHGGLGAMLMQDGDDGVKRVIGFCSRRLHSYEKSYPAFVLELSAAVYGMQYFRNYLLGKSFALMVDHKPLCKLSTTHTKTFNRLQHLMLEMFPDIKYVPKDKHTVADFLSRYQGMGAAIVDANPPRVYVLQQEDMLIKPMYDRTRALMDELKLPEGGLCKPPGAKNQLTIRAGVLLTQRPKRLGFVDINPLKIVTPQSMRQEILAEAHNSVIAGHGGIFRTAERIRATFWWSGIETDVQNHINACDICQAASDKNAVSAPPPLAQLPLPKGPNLRVHVDLFGSLACEPSPSAKELDAPAKVPTLKGSAKRFHPKKYVLIMTDAFTKLVVLKIIDDKSSATVARGILEGWIYTYGTPLLVVSDQGPEFANDLQQELFKLLQIEHVMTSPYHPKTSGQVEIYNRLMQQYLRSVLLEAKRSQMDWQSYILPLQFSHNTAVQKSTKVSPHYALFGYDPRVPLWETGDVIDFKSHSAADQYFRTQNVHFQLNRIITNNLQHAREQQKSTHDRDAAGPVVYNVGDACWTRINTRPGPNPKLSKMWEKATVVERCGEYVYKVRRENRRIKKLAKVNIQQMKPCKAAIPDTDDDSESDGDDGDAAGEDDDDGDLPELDAAQRPAPARPPPAPAPPAHGHNLRVRKPAKVNSIDMSGCPIDFSKVKPKDVYRLLQAGYSLVRHGGGGAPAAAADPALPHFPAGAALPRLPSWDDSGSGSEEPTTPDDFVSADDGGSGKDSTDVFGTPYAGAQSARKFGQLSKFGSKTKSLRKAVIRGFDFPATRVSSLLRRHQSLSATERRRAEETPPTTPTAVPLPRRIPSLSRALSAQQLQPIPLSPSPPPAPVAQLSWPPAAPPPLSRVLRQRPTPAPARFDPGQEEEREKRRRKKRKAVSPSASPPPPSRRRD